MSSVISWNWLPPLCNIVVPTSRESVKYVSATVREGVACMWYLHGKRTYCE